MKQDLLNSPYRIHLLICSAYRTIALKLAAQVPGNGRRPENSLAADIVLSDVLEQEGISVDDVRQLLLADLEACRIANDLLRGRDLTCVGPTLDDQLTAATEPTPELALKLYCVLAGMYRMLAYRLRDSVDSDSAMVASESFEILCTQNGIELHHVMKFMRTDSVATIETATQILREQRAHTVH